MGSPAPWWIAALALVVSIGSFVVSFLAYRRASEKHEWERDERTKAEARRMWCMEQRDWLNVHWSEEVDLTTDKVEWANWGQENGYFVIRRGLLGPVLRKAGDPRP